MTDLIARLRQQRYGDRGLRELMEAAAGALAARDAEITRLKAELAEARVEARTFWKLRAELYEKRLTACAEVLRRARLQAFDRLDIVVAFSQEDWQQVAALLSTLPPERPTEGQAS